MKKKSYFKKFAVLGIQGLKRVLMDRVVFVAQLSNARAFETERDALDWLIAEELRR